MDLFAQEVRFFGISEEVLSNLQTMEGYVPYQDEEQRDLPRNKWQRKVGFFMFFFFIRLGAMQNVTPKIGYFKPPPPHVTHQKVTVL